MKYKLKESREILERTPYIIQAFLKNISSDWAKQNEGGESWSPYEILGHLIHGERTDWIPRCQIILDFGTSHPFTPFDRNAQKNESKGKSLSQLIDEFKKLRKENLAKLDAMELTEEDLEKKGMHPALGEVNLSELLASWTVHDLSHIAQIARVMAKQYRNEIGPWEEYLTIVS